MKSAKEIKIGTILKDSFNGMSYFFRVIKTTEKSVTVEKLQWETCAPDKSNDDPTYCTARIRLDNKGEPIVMKDLDGKPIVKTHRIRYNKNGDIYLPSFRWSNCAQVSIVEDIHKKYQFYWG